MQAYTDKECFDNTSSLGASGSVLTLGALKVCEGNKAALEAVGQSSR